MNEPEQFLIDNGWIKETPREGYNTNWIDPRNHETRQIAMWIRSNTK